MDEGTSEAQWGSEKDVFPPHGSLVGGGQVT